MRARTLLTAAALPLAVALLGVTAGPAFAGNGQGHYISDVYPYDPNGTAVWCVQVGLNYYDHVADPSNANWQNWVSVDKSYGPKTTQGVKWFQEHVNAKYHQNLSVDGQVGDQTGWWLQEYLEEAAYTGYNTNAIEQLCPSVIPDGNYSWSFSSFPNVS